MVFQIPETDKLRFPESKYISVRFDVLSSLATTFRVYILTKHSLVMGDIEHPGNRLNVYKILNLPDFPLVLRLHNRTGVAYRGRVYVRAELICGGFALTQLFAGYMTPWRALTWPDPIKESEVTEPGWFHSLTGTDPSAGSEISETVPTNTIWRIKAIVFSLTTDTTAVSRSVSLIIDDGTNVIFRSKAAPSQTESSTRTYIFSSVETDADFDVNNTVRIQIPDLKLTEGYRVRTSTNNLQSGDNFTAPILFVEEWVSIW